MYSFAGYDAATAMLEKVVPKSVEGLSEMEVVENRIFFLTDMCPTQGETSPSGLFGKAQKCAEKGIFSTFLGKLLTLIGIRKCSF